MRYLAILFSLFSFNALACSCTDYDIKAAFNEYPVVFVGTVEDVEVVKVWEGWFSYSESKVVTLSIEQNYKDADVDKIIVATSAQSSACGYPFEANVRYAVFAFPDEKEFHVDSCSPTIHMEKREEQDEAQRLLVTKFLLQQTGT